MRSAERISRKPDEWAERQRAERQAHLRAALGMLRKARDEGAEWYWWIANGKPRYTDAEYAAISKGKRR